MSSTRFMASPYNTRAQQQLVYSRTENGKREIAARTNRAKLKNAPKPFKPHKHLIDTIMEPPKLTEPGHTTRSTRAQTRSQGPPEESKQQPP
jgi:hypothetical protein